MTQLETAIAALKEIAALTYDGDPYYGEEFDEAVSIAKNAIQKISGEEPVNRTTSGETLLMGLYSRPINENGDVWSAPQIVRYVTDKRQGLAGVEIEYVQKGGA